MKLMLTFAIVVASSTLLLTACRQRSAVVKPADVDYYTCTMHTSVKSQHPNDKCPICSMELVPVLKRSLERESVGAAERNSIDATNAPDAIRSDAPTPQRSDDFTIPVQRLQQIGVTFATIEKQRFQHTIRTVGVATYDVQRHWDYVVRVDGYVQNLFVFSRGELVEKDAPLLTIYSPDLLITMKEFLGLLRMRDAVKAKVDSPVLESTDRLIASAKDRLRLWNISGKEILEIERTRQPLDHLTLYSPFKGVVQTLGVDQGRRVMTGDHLVDVVDLSEVWVWAQFYQDELPLLKKGLPVRITSSSHPGETFHGTISVVDPFVGDASRTSRVRIDVENPELKLRPDMYVDVDLMIAMGEALAVPVSAVLPTGKHQIVFVDKGSGQLEPRDIELGRKFDDVYEVKSGVKEGERVVNSANFLIDAEAKVQGALKGW